MVNGFLGGGASQLTCPEVLAPCSSIRLRLAEGPVGINVPGRVDEVTIVVVVEENADSCVDMERHLMAFDTKPT